MTSIIFNFIIVGMKLKHGQIVVQVAVDDELWRRTKAVAALNKITLSNFISQSVRAALIRCEQIKSSSTTTPTRKD